MPAMPPKTGAFLSGGAVYALSPSRCSICKPTFSLDQSLEDIEMWTAYLERAVNLTILHKIPPLHRSIAAIVSRHANIFCEIDLDRAKQNALGSRSARVFLQNLKVDRGFLQHAAAVDRESHGKRCRVVKVDFVVFDRGFGSATTVLGGSGVGEMPFYKGDARNQGHVIEVD